jgi:hypothetical protein
VLVGGWGGKGSGGRLASGCVFENTQRLIHTLQVGETERERERGGGWGGE